MVETPVVYSHSPTLSLDLAGLRYAPRQQLSRRVFFVSGPSMHYYGLGWSLLREGSDGEEVDEESGHDKIGRAKFFSLQNPPPYISIRYLEQSEARSLRGALKKRKGRDIWRVSPERRPRFVRAGTA